MNSPPTKHPWLALFVLVLPVLMISMDGTILGFAIPHLSADLEPSSSALLWIIDIYSFVLAGLLITMGAIGDRIGRRKLLMFGAAGFSIASVFAAFAPSAAALIAARAVLGVAGATLLPSTLALIRNVFPNETQRQLAIAIWAATFAAGSAVGPIVGGFLLDHYWWGSVFLLAAPVTAALLVLAPRFTPESRDPDPGPFDLGSSALSMTTMLPTVYAIKSFAEGGLSWMMAIAFGVGIGSGIMFVRRQLRQESPMIDIKLFFKERFRIGVLGNLIACFGFAGAMFFVTQYLQLVSGLSAFSAGIHLLPSVAASIIVTILAPQGARRFGSFGVVTAGLFGGAAGFAVLFLVGVNTSVWFIVLAAMIINGSLGAAMAVSIDGILASVPPRRAGEVSSVSETANELGIALGTAVLGSIMTAVYRTEISGLVNIPADAIAHAKETLGAAFVAAATLGEPQGSQLAHAAQSAFVEGLNRAGLAATVIMFGVAILAARVHRHGPDTPEPAGATSLNQPG